LQRLSQKRSLYVILAFIIIVIVTIIMSLNSAYTYKITKEKIINEMEKSSELSILSLEKNIKPLIESYAVNEYMNLISNEMARHSYLSVVIKDRNMGKIIGEDVFVSGSIRNAAGSVVDFNSENNRHVEIINKSYYTNKHEIIAISGRSLGSLEIYISDQSITEELNKIITNTIGNALAISVFLIFSLLVTIRKYILKPVSDITKVISHSDEDGIPLGYFAKAGSLEIESLSNSMNNMIDAIKDSRLRLTEQHAELAISKERLSMLGAAMEAASDGIIITDVNGDIEWVNSAFEKLSGISSGEAIEGGTKILNSGRQDEFFYKELWQTILSGKTWHGELLNKRKDGSVFLEEDSITPVLDESGEIGHFVAIKRDITDQRQKELLLQRSQKMDSLGKLTGGVAHDYNNMLGVILGYSEILKSSVADDPKLAKYIGEIHRAGERGAKLTKKLLSFSRQQATGAESTDINALLTDARDMLEKTLTVGVRLVMELEDCLWPVWVDSSDLEDAILNMSINAKHAMKNTGQLTFTTSNELLNETDAGYMGLEPGEYVLLLLTDTGEGMDEITQKRIFDPFFSTKGDKGTGLGLSQVYGFVNRAKGCIKVYSEPQHGTRLALYFPRYKDPSGSGVANNKPAEVSLSGNETILLVDDEQALVDLSEVILTGKGYRVLTANNGIEALKILESETVDLLLSDIIMPEMDGYQLAGKVQKLYPEIKIQLASGFNDISGEAAAGVEELQKNILQKPFNSQTLLQRVRMLLDVGSKDKKEDKSEEKETATSYAPLEWSDDISMNINELDEDHKKMLSLVNRSQQVMTGRGSDVDLKIILNELLDYSKVHFKHEEDIMKICAYPDIEKHKQAHQFFNQQIAVCIEESEAGRLTAKKLFDFLVVWLTDHIMNMDQKMVPWIKGKEEEIIGAIKNNASID